MLIFVHIAIAIFSFIVATSGLIRPSRLKLGVSYSSIVITILSGSFLATYQNINLAQVCLSGTVYTVVITYITVMGGRKLASLELED